MGNESITTLYIFFRAHNAAVTCTLFAPVPELIFEAVERGREAAGKAREDAVASGLPSSPLSPVAGGCGVDILGEKEPLSGRSNNMYFANSLVVGSLL